MIPLLKLLNFPHNILGPKIREVILVKEALKDGVEAFFVVGFDALIVPLFEVGPHVAKVKRSTAHGTARFI